MRSSMLTLGDDVQRLSAARLWILDQLRVIPIFAAAVPCRLCRVDDGAPLSLAG